MNLGWQELIALDGWVCVRSHTELQFNGFCNKQRSPLTVSVRLYLHCELHGQLKVLSVCDRACSRTCVRARAHARMYVCARAHLCMRAPFVFLSLSLALCSIHENLTAVANGLNYVKLFPDQME